MNKRSIPACIATLSCIFALAACAGPGPTDTAFPKLDTAMTPEGSFPNVDHLRMVEPGMTKGQVYDLIGVPHFHESVFRVRVWNYLFHFRSADKSVACQYQIQFDDDNRVTKTRWADPQCETFAPAKPAQ
ncbi:outer membrane protein assembly factor BamE [Ralstonia sp. CHL-2022]|uniref:Outer membrane protein assembly factor BamE n=1 Tax=Ralstonia mojiangensis TaxID=2953895 RepID=A0ABT2LBP3_9RALS|nr:outer membrane protein assembly factor BamE [Ralstonia mojiangensis]MCT7297729.1 outer membrane protein assembly factor BamE [Ralstonia mojiangensis]MCT7312069.1 outer membrane protein assembly factor BamE [Ralstonia mojiangensis]